VLLPVLKSRIPNDIFCHFGLLVTALQLLNKDVAVEEEIQCAEDMLDHYHQLDVQLYGDNSQTFTNHGLTHLAAQRRVHGCPLLLLSNFVFEGFIGTLKRQFHGTRNIIPQMITNIAFLQNIDKIMSNIHNPKLLELAEKITTNNSTPGTRWA